MRINEWLRRSIREKAAPSSVPIEKGLLRTAFLNSRSLVLLLLLASVGSVQAAFNCIAGSECVSKNEEVWCWYGASGCSPPKDPPNICPNSISPTKGFLTAQAWGDWAAVENSYCQNGATPGSGISFPNPAGTDTFTYSPPDYAVGWTRHWFFNYGGPTNFATMARGARGWSCPPGWSLGFSATDSFCHRLRIGTNLEQPCQNNCPVSNPVLPIEQSKLDSVTDFAGSEGLALVRHYNSASRRNTAGDGVGTLGPKWASNWDAELRFDFANMVRALRPQGDQIQFTKVSGNWVAWAGEVSTLTEIPGATGTQVAWKIRDGRDRVESYMANGKLTRIENRDGSFVDLTYNAQGLLSAAIARDGRRLTFNWTTIGGFYQRVSSVNLPDGNTITYQFDSIHGRLASVSDSVGLHTTYLYAEPAHSAYTGADGAYYMTGIQDASGSRYATYKYDNTGRAIETGHAGGAGKHTFALTDTYVDIGLPSGGIERRTYAMISGSQRVWKTEKRECEGCAVTHTKTFTYDGNGFQDLSTDYRGITTDFNHDSRGLETQRIEVANTTCPVDVPNCLLSRRTTQTDWHATFRVPLERRLLNASAVLEQVTRFAYNSRGQQTARCQIDPTNGTAMAFACGSANPAPTGVRQTLSVYCNATDGDINTATCPREGVLKSVDGPRTDVSDITSFKYRAADAPTCASAPTTCAYRKGDLWKTTNALGQVSETLSFDGSGRVRSAKDSNGVTTDIEYNARGQLSRRLLRGTNSLSESDDAITAFTYETFGAISRVTQPNGSYLNYHYDAAHRLTGVSDNAGDRIDYTLDAAGNRTKEVTKDPVGSVKRLLARQFDALSRLKSQINAPYAAHSNLDDPSVEKTRFAVDTNGNTDTTTDPLDVVTDNAYDALNRLVQSIGDQGAGRINANSQFTYDARDNLRTVTDPKGLVTTYTYDGLNNQIQLDSPDTGKSPTPTTYQFDSAGNRTQQTDARGVVTNFAFDALNRLSTQTFPNAALNVAFTYDDWEGCPKAERFGAGRLVRFTDETGSTVLCHDRRGNTVRKIVARYGETRTTRWNYDLADRVVQMTYPSGTIVNYTRDTRGRITQLKVTPVGGSQITVISGVTYLPFGPVQQITWGNGQTMTRNFDQNYWIDQINSSATNSLDLDFTLDDAGNITGLSDVLGAGPAANTYNYDNLYRLTGVVANGQSVEAYTYDETGNRESKQVGNGPVQEYEYPSTSHRLTSVDGTARTFDPNGNTLSSALGTRTFDDRNRFVTLTAGRNVSTFQYNARGERVLKSVRGSNTTFDYNEAGQLLTESEGYPADQRDIIWLDNLPVATFSQITGLSYVQPDHLGSPRKLVNPSDNSVVWNWPIIDNAFGETAPTGIWFNLRFPGQYSDGETNYNYFRDYEPGTGRYVESDPIGIRGGIATYSYVGSDPLSFLDPLGLEKLGCKEKYLQDKVGMPYVVRYDCSSYREDCSPAPSDCKDNCESRKVQCKRNAKFKELGISTLADLAGGKFLGCLGSFSAGAVNAYMSPTWEKACDDGYSDCMKDCPALMCVIY